MRITYIHQYFNTPDMSGGTRSYEMARRLVDKGHQVNMITSWRHNDVKTSPFETVEDGITVHWAPVPYSNYMSYRQRINSFLQFVVSAGRKAASLPSDLILATSTPLTIALPAVYAARRHSVPMVFEVRDLWPELPIAIGALKNPVWQHSARWLERWAYRNSEAVIALSPGMRDGVCRTGYPSDRVAVIPNSSDNDLFHAATRSGAAFRRARAWLGERPLIVYAGSFGRINGAGYLVDIAARLLKTAPDIRILLVGDGQERTKIIEKAKALGVYETNLFLEDPVTKREMPDVLAAADLACSLFVDLPEMQANSANKFFDALASGTPVLLNYGGWHAELVTREQAGLVVWGKSTEEAVAQIVSSLRDQVWMREAGENARATAERLFDRDVLANQLEHVLVMAYERQGNRVATIKAPSETSAPAPMSTAGPRQA
ncbi:Glycosyltransferase involved in cell wall bisynthesis [Thiohalomonas denitrificans]|uniref:Glycosyltransferase involved in cell wall bisynthesis n=2 Tax=Thiohalomonas denitrificans TaxID=415747 RepID=A0A1G5QI79_9GAMM|nr:Glycosyltransferase involved in cell wall bisynthesis [Thiohalomonas denitrificans]